MEKRDPIQEQLIAARRNQILDAAVQVFAEKGFHRATIKDVAKAAGVADGTIYNYFENKTALILGLLNRLNESEERPEHFAQATEMDSREFTRRYVQQRFETLSQGGEIFQVLLSEILVNKDLREMYYEQILAPTYALAEQYFQQQVEQGLIRPVDVPLTMRAISAMFLGVLILRIMGDPELKERWDKMPFILSELILDGLSQDKGEK